MKTVLLLLALFIGSLLNAQTATTHELEVTIPNVTNDNGEVLFALYKEENFMREPTFSQKSDIKDGKATVKFEDLPEGDYALVVMHDENSNGRMDFETNGMPTESYATSGESKFMGPPMWSDTKFKLDDSTKKLSLRF
ncbi:DUF2141 domain-containing protein [Christiangramia sp. LLG6405-1]|uniref:DUF2141 domain-containing protein n=1 Tax=Christiangramia sp. LLG6405-1 TaxID=3160832 RepID=UPI00386B4B65